MVALITPLTVAQKKPKEQTIKKNQPSDSILHACGPAAFGRIGVLFRRSRKREGRERPLLPAINIRVRVRVHDPRHAFRVSRRERGSQEFQLTTDVPKSLSLRPLLDSGVYVFVPKSATGSGQSPCG